MAKLKKDLKVFRILGTQTWAWSAYGAIMDTGSKEEMEAAKKCCEEGDK